MLKFEDSFTLDKKVDAFLREFVNNALKRAVAGFIECCENKDDEVYFPKFVYDDDLPSCVFPKSYPGNEEQMLAVLKGLYSLLNSDKEFVPTLLMEYVLAHIIQACIDIYYDEQSDIEEYGEDNFEKFEEELLAGMSKENREAFLQQKKEWERDNHTPDKSVNFPFSMLGWDTYENDYFGLEPGFESEIAIKEAKKKLQQYTKADLIEAASQCFLIAVNFLSLRSRYEDLKASMDIIRETNKAELDVLRHINELYQKADVVSKGFRYDWKHEVIDLQKLIDSIDPQSRIWLQ